MPRPPLGDKAMTGAERLRRWRERKRQERGPVETERSARVALGKAQQEIADLRRQLAAAWAAKATAEAEPSSDDRKQSPASTKANPWNTKPSADSRAAHQNAVLRQEVARLKAALAQEPDKQKIARLEEQLRDWKARVRRQEKHHDERMQLRFPRMTRETFNAVMKCLHPDSTPTDKQRQEASGRFTDWKAEDDKAIARFGR